MTKTETDLSVLIPFFNEEGNVIPLIEEVRACLDGIRYEIVCVNDCSDDKTAEELAEALSRWPDQVRVLTHIRRRVQSADRKAAGNLPGHSGHRRQEAGSIGPEPFSAR